VTVRSGTDAPSSVPMGNGPAWSIRSPAGGQKARRRRPARFRFLLAGQARPTASRAVFRPGGPHPSRWRRRSAAGSALPASLRRCPRSRGAHLLLVSLLRSSLRTRPVSPRTAGVRGWRRATPARTSPADLARREDRGSASRCSTWDGAPDAGRRRRRLPRAGSSRLHRPSRRTRPVYHPAGLPAAPWRRVLTAQPERRRGFEPRPEGREGRPAPRPPATGRARGPSPSGAGGRRSPTPRRGRGGTAARP
jgi:hypothetical protein